MRDLGMSTVTTKWILKPETEFRFEVSPTETVKLRLISGTAEIFGAELSLDVDYLFTGVKYAAFSYEGACIEITGKCIVEYISEECVVPFYLNLHLCLESIRNEAISNNSSFPRILVLGTGRNTCARTLINYSIRQGRFPLVVDLDVLNGSLMFPGVASSAVINRIIEPEEGFNVANPLAFYYGSTVWNENPRYFFQVVKALGRNADELLGNMQSTGSNSKVSGMIGIFSSWVEGKADELLKVALEALKINTLVVVGNERLYNSVKKEHASDKLKIISISKVPGLVTRETSVRRYLASKRIREYFYGFNEEYYPYSHTISLKEVEVWKISDGMFYF